MTMVTANELKTKGVSHIEKALQVDGEVIVSVRGEPRFVMVDIARYEFLRGCELEAAWQQAQEDVAAGRFRRESAADHIVRIKADVSDAA